MASGEPDSIRVRSRPATALLAVIALVLALPVTATAAAAEPVTLADWLRSIFVTPDRKIDFFQPSVAVTTPPPPVPAVQTSSEPAPPKEPIVRTDLPRFWLSRDLQKVRRRRRGRSRR